MQNINCYNHDQKLNVLSVYAPTLEVSEATPEIREQFYSDLEAVLATLSSRDALVIVGDFNAKTGSAHEDELYHDTIGKYGKGKVNSNGIHLLNFAKLHGLRLSNTFFKHKPSQISTWECPDRISDQIDAVSNTIRRNPYRNQIDYICTKNDYKGIKVHDSRSYNVMTTNSDHKLVMMTCTFKWPFNKQKQSTRSLDFQKLADPAIRLEYQKETEEILSQQQPPTNNQERWNNNVISTKEAAEKVVGFKANKTHKYDNTEIVELSKKQKEIKLKIDNTADDLRADDLRAALRTSRNCVINELHRIIRYK